VNLERHIRAVPDFPAPGILFRDITPLLADPQALRASVDAMCDPWRESEIELVAAMEARGFVFGAAMALRLDAGFVPVRKPGKLPRPTRSVAYALEYRDDVLHIHEDALGTKRRVLVVDDVIATGGTAAAVADLIERLGGEVIGLQFLVELADLGGRGHLRGRRVHSVVTFGEKGTEE
jgi:adenine phosphoribosyltransferase